MARKSNAPENVITRYAFALIALYLISRRHCQQLQVTAEEKSSFLLDRATATLINQVL